MQATLHISMPLSHVDVKLSKGFGMLLAPKFILSMTFIGLLLAVGYANYMNPGSSKQRPQVKVLFSLDKPSHVPQLIHYIGTEASVGEEVAEEIICAGCRELTGYLECYKDVLPLSQISVTNTYL
jgi:hypothetical protein